MATEKKDMVKFQEKIYETILSSSEITPMNGMMQAAVLMKTSIEIYTYLFSEDSQIEHMLEIAKGTITQIRENHKPGKYPTLH